MGQLLVLSFRLNASLMSPLSRRDYQWVFRDFMIAQRKRIENKKRGFG